MSCLSVLSTEHGLYLRNRPANSLPRTQGELAETSVVPQSYQKTILVVDDNPDILKFVTGILTASNYRVITAGSGAEALQQSKNFRSEIHLLLTDLQMPRMSGIDLATLMSADRPQLQVLMMSGFSDRMFVLNEGWLFLAKLFIPSQLLALVLGLVAPDCSFKFAPINLN